jgi:hypothetical protein
MAVARQVPGLNGKKCDKCWGLGLNLAVEVFFVYANKKYEKYWGKDEWLLVLLYEVKKKYFWFSEYLNEYFCEKFHILVCLVSVKR